MTNDKPEYGKQYALTGQKGDKCISNGNTWAESEVKTLSEECGAPGCVCDASAELV